MTAEGEVEGLMGKLARALSPRNTSHEATRISTVQNETPSKSPRDAEISSNAPVQEPTAKRTVTPEHLQDVILAGLQKIAGFPQNGVSITVYGFRPWNAMITFAPGSVSSKTAAAYREMLPQLIEELRKQFDTE
ncbi:hypothetical protein [Bradyrhizobium sp. Tv2a-2]|uniref:hypothetical protein n=1 Tax=Bradyrhizobium sp. Tv2a-2 TaxID=113395 RepID=UPI0006841A98|nr:hypothetical protein [Bradyrhizobium sp. Tv2a-2]